MRFSIGLILMFMQPIFSSCSCSDLTREDHLCYSTINTVSEKMRQQGFIVIGRGVKIPKKIRGMDVHYVMYGEYTVDQARILFVNCVEEMIKEANSKEEMRPYMEEYPFTNENIEIILGFRGTPNDEFYPPYVSSVLNVNNKIYYSTFDSETGRSKEMHSEPYVEGLRIVRETCH